jgi:type II secretory pathway pseudopilin PulG
MPLKHGGGFTLFELIAYILVVSITASVAYNRFAGFPGAAERANFMTVTVQLKAGINLQMMNAIARGNWSELRNLEGSNPMDLMLETPTNYVGELSVYDRDTLPGRVWYFDTRSRELVYVAGDATNLYSVENGQRIPANVVRFRITMKYSGGDMKNWEGIVLEPSTPYAWNATDLGAPEVLMQ